MELKHEKNLFVMRTLISMGVLFPTLWMLWNQNYPDGVFWNIAWPLYLCLGSMAFAAARRYALRLEMHPLRASAVAALGFASAGIIPLAYLLVISKQSGQSDHEPPETRPLDCRMPVIIDGKTYREAGAPPEDGT
ncbi:MAG: hypothetical protein ACYC55_09705 [Candidatus Geothermincolia bacterium]